jgi:hypothetical protein|tara:strand:- start:564 stop:902 length:339 start_codon:yes stop_codon:yes gene_type:complete
MSVKLTILKSGETLISDMQELVSDEKQASPHAYLLINPHRVRMEQKNFLTEDKDDKKYPIDVSLTPWIVLSTDKKYILPVDCVMTIAEPVDGVKKLFIDKCEAFNLEENLNG